MKIEDLKMKVSENISERNYFGAFEIIDLATVDYLKSEIKDYRLCIELIYQKPLARICNRASIKLE